METCDRLDRMEKRVGTLEKAKEELLAKMEDLENRSRRNKLRVIGLPEEKARGSQLLCRDISSALSKKRAAFKPIKAKLFNKGVWFFLRYPAVLCLTHQKKEYRFKCVDAAAAESFFNEHFSAD
ncbi:hypothetical protein GOODEAATRI_026451 [Goodea atripinnis]|uniref:Uncharacterized protein n=1 Tax=Goodea atripinnis TaxID=208336 RepID=A0ABV0Q1D6_9TELE